MKARNFAVAVLAMSFLAGCGRAPPPNLSADQVDQILDTQSTLAEEQAALGRGRDALEEDRRLWAERDRGDPIIAKTIQSAAVLLACSAPMVIVAYLLLGPVRNLNNELPMESPDLFRMLEDDPKLLRIKSKPKEPASSPELS